MKRQARSGSAPVAALLPAGAAAVPGRRRLVTSGVTVLAVLLLSITGMLGATTASAAASGATVVGWGDDSSGQTEVPAGLTGVTAVAAGYGHSLALKGDGTVVAWGDDRLGQTDVPAGLTGVTAIAAGEEHSLALTDDGTVVGWGYDNGGQTDVPAGLTGVTAIAAGERHSLALKSDGTVVGWGNDRYGQIDVPAGLTGVTAIAAGERHSLALKGDGTVVGWGDDGAGQTDPPGGLSGVTAIAAGSYGGLALKGDGTVVGWGDDNFGQTDVPAGLSGVTAIAAGYIHSLALKGDGTVVGWGDDDNGQTDPPGGLSGVTAIAAGSFHSLAVGRLKQPGSVAFTSTAPTPGVVGGSYTPTTAGGGSAKPVVLSIASASTDGACTLSDGVVSFTGPGSCVIDADQAGDSSTTPAPTATQTVTVKQAGTVAFTSSPPNPGLVGDSYTPTTAGGDSSRPVVLSIDAASTDGTCALDSAGTTVSFTGSGSCVIDADQAGDSSTTAAPTATQTVTVDSTPVFTSASPPTTGTAGTLYTADFTASGSPTPTYQLTGGPAFLTIDSSTGRVSGTPTAPGTFRYAVKATNRAGTVTIKTFTVTVAAAAWQASVRGYTPPAAGSSRGYTLGVKKNAWTLQDTQPGKARTPFSGTITLDTGTFTHVSGLKLESGDTFSVKGHTLTFSFSTYGDLDGVTFTTPEAATTITFTLNIAGKPATGGQVFTGADHTASPTGSPLTYRRTPGQ